MPKSLQVGMIGVSADRGWARESHVPAVQKLAGLELAAVATSHQETANAAARAFHAAAAYGDASALIRDPNINIVVICVKAPAHLKLVHEALTAGKHVYCEWPLGCNLSETEQITTAADAAGVHAVVGLQARMSPTVLQAREVIMSGEIGRTLSARIYSSTAAFGPKVSVEDSYLEKAENGVTLVSIQGAHTLDTAIAILGELMDVTTLTTIQYPTIQIGDNTTLQSRSIPDHLLVEARLVSGGALSIEVAGGRSSETPFVLEITGEKGVLAVEGGAERGFQAGRLSLSLNNVPQYVDQGELSTMPDAAINVAGVYTALRDDIIQGSSTAPDFEHAIRLNRLIDDVMSSSQIGVRKAASHWPM